MEPVRRPRVLAEIDPHSEWVQGREFDTLVVDVTGIQAGWPPAIFSIQLPSVCLLLLRRRDDAS